MAKYGINKAILVGNLGRDPEIRYLDNGAAVANFTLATTEKLRRADGTSEDRTQWHNIVMWRGLAETASKYLRKGATVYLEGKIINRSWDDANGQKKYWTEIEVQEMRMLDSRGSQQDSSAPPYTEVYGQTGPQGQPDRQNPNPQAQPKAQPVTQTPVTAAPQNSPAPNPIDTAVSGDDADDLPF